MNKCKNVECTIVGDFMGWKGLIRDTVMFAVGIALLVNWLKAQTAAVVLIVTAAVFSVYAWYRFFKG